MNIARFSRWTVARVTKANARRGSLRPGLSFLISFTLSIGRSPARADTLAAGIRLPDNVVVSSESGLAPDLAAFSGAWGGDSWGGNLPVLLVVERITPDRTAHLVYAWDNSTDGKIKAGWRRMEAHIAESRLSVSTPPGAATIRYQRLEDGALLGRYESRGITSYVRLTQFSGTDSAAIKAHAATVRRLWEELRIPENSTVGETTGRSLTLQAMLYRSSESGRRPLMIFSHGSTGGGELKPAYFPQIMDGAIPRIFLSLGFNVVQPLRKGFGKSDGPLLEESFPREQQKNQLNSALEDLDATVRYMASQPYVDPRRIVLVGQSRGGMLSVAYAGRHPEQVAAVINFAGGWWGERMPTRDFNIEQFSEAGHSAKAPMLWMYALDDSYYSQKFIERCFDAFLKHGGKGQLVEVPDVPGDGHLLVTWPDRWRPRVVSYLAGLGFKADRPLLP